MNTEISGVILQWTLLVTLCYPLGRYIAKVYRGERTWLDFMAPVERAIYRFCGIDPAVEMNWKQFLKALLTVNLFWFFWGMLLLVFQGWLPLNPDGNPGQSPDLAFNTCISFMVNCNLQHYSGETGLSYFTQLFVIMLFQFVTAACGMAAMAGMMKALAGKTKKTIGNFWVFLTRSVTRILLPLSLAVGILLVINGTPMSFDGKQTLTTLEGTEQVISQGPTAAIVPIKQLGTNGGGYFGTNSAHPLENPNAFTNILECWSILILPMAMVFAFGFYTRRRSLATWIFGVMLLAYTAGVVLSVWQETGGSRQIDGMGISQELGSMEGKEIRIGSAASAMWGMTTTVTSNGSVNSMHDSQTPLSGMLQMLNMQINCWFGGVGVGWMNYFAFLIIAVFISGLMVGRTPEFLGRKVEAREMKIATLVVLLHPFLILVGTGISAAVRTISENGGTPLVVCENERITGVIELQDIIKTGIRERFERLRRMGVKTVMVTGDNPLTAKYIAEKAGVDDFIAEARPEDKLEYIRREQQSGKLVAMMGDGTNDAPALAQADVGVAMNSGTQAAKEAGNMVDLDNDPTKLIEIVEIGKQLLMTRGTLTTFSIANDVAKYFAIVPALFIASIPSLGALNVMHLHSPESAILSAVIFNALIIPLLIPLALRGVTYKPIGASALLRRNLFIYGLGGVIVPFVGIKLIDMLISVFF